MATSSKKGKLFILFLILVCVFTHVFCDPNSFVVTETESLSENKIIDNENLSEKNILENYLGTQDILSRHQVQLEKLEELVKNLSELVTRLESRFSESARIKILDDKKLSNDKSLRFGNKERVNSDEVVKGKGDGNLEGESRDGGKVGAVPITRYSPVWAESFHFASAVKLRTNPTCLNVLPFKDDEGLSKYVAVGDDGGRVYFLLKIGDVSEEFSTLSGSPVSVMLSYLTVYKNESILVTGHEDGSVFMYRLWEEPNGEELSSLRVEKIGKFASEDVGGVGSAVTVLEVHYVGRKRYILSADFDGKIRVLREDGELYGEVAPPRKPLAFLKQRLLFLTDTGAGSLDLRNMKIRTSECEGLNNTVVKEYIFDATERSKAYGYTSDGFLIHTLLLGDITNFKCRIRSKRKVEMDEPLSLQSIKGYMLIANQEKVAVYNISSYNYVMAGGPRFMFSVNFDEIKSSFVNHQPVELSSERRTLIPLVASDREKLVILNLGSGYIGMYGSSLPLFKNDFNTMLWTSPFLFFILFLFGAYYFFANKKGVNLLGDTMIRSTCTDHKGLD
ncbi:hypothetical protein Leryth_014584 [Lithospermum erythrorhizon]|nr:hypothetical protein Leryth_014584 [Lithospermum erythrorhizon]